MSNSRVMQDTGALSCIIWMHGLGADSSDMEGLAKELKINKVQHIFLDAPLRPITINNNMQLKAWYDIKGFDRSSLQDLDGIKGSKKQIEAAIETQIAAGFKSDNIFLAGFSQGGAMALITALDFTKPLGGAIALSAYLPIAKHCEFKQGPGLPIYMANGLYDPIIDISLAKESVEFMRSHGFHKINFETYPIEHSVCFEEIQALSQWVNTIVMKEQ